MMSSKHLRGDINYAWPTAEIAVMGAKVSHFERGILCACGYGGHTVLWKISPEKCFTKACGHQPMAIAYLWENVLLRGLSYIRDGHARIVTRDQYW